MDAARMMDNDAADIAEVADVPFGAFDEGAFNDGAMSCVNCSVTGTIDDNINFSELFNVTPIWVNDTTGEDNVPVTLLRDIALGTVLGVLSLLTFVGNAMVLHAVRTDKRLQTVSSY